MSRLVVAGLILVGASTLGATFTGRVAPPPPAADVFEVVIGNGPHAGTYKLSADIICMHVKAQKRFSAAYRDIDAKDAKSINSAGINVFNPDDPGAKQGQVNVTFGDAAAKTEYQASVPGDSKGPLTMTRKGQSVEVAFRGQTKSGIALQMTAACGSVSEF